MQQVARMSNQEVLEYVKIVPRVSRSDNQNDNNRTRFPYYSYEVYNKVVNCK